MKVYYNEWESKTAAWLQKLGEQKCIPLGHVDDRSIRDVRPNDLHGYSQCHFFAGIGGWAHALDLAGYRDLPCWTGSPPCQPFSVAGKQAGSADERHLAPVWLDLIRECRPPIIFGEQVADAIRIGWLDDLFDALEGCGYACGAAVLPACSVGAPHIRKRLFFGAIRLAYANPLHGKGDEYRLFNEQKWNRSFETQARPSNSGFNNSPWGDGYWKTCQHDKKDRLRKPGIPLLVNGIPNQLDQIAGFGNAIVPQVAAEFVKAFMESVDAP